MLEMPEEVGETSRLLVGLTKIFFLIVAVVSFVLMLLLIFKEDDVIVDDVADDLLVGEWDDDGVPCHRERIECCCQ